VSLEEAGPAVRKRGVRTSGLASRRLQLFVLQLSALLLELETKESATQSELNELRLREKDLSEDVAHLKRENEAVVTPALTALSEDIAEGKAETVRAQLLAESLVGSNREMSTRIHEIQAQAAAAANTTIALKAELLKVRADPLKLNKAADTVKKAIDDVQSEIGKITAAMSTRQAEISEQGQALKEVGEVRKGLDAKLARYRVDIEARGQELTAVENSLRNERMQHRDLLERRVEMQAEETEAFSEVRLAEQGRETSASAYERAKRELKKTLDQYNDLSEKAIPAEADLTERHLEVDRLRTEGRDLEASLTKVKKEMDFMIATFLKEEGVEKKLRDKLEDVMSENTALETEKDHWHREEGLSIKVGRNIVC
jgi:chromosome segregation ATPase